MMILNLLDENDISSINRTPLSGRHVYFISDENEDIVYIGQTYAPDFRMGSHRSNDKFHSIQLMKVCDNIDLVDVEFMEILKHKPKHNMEFTTPSFLITKTKIISEGIQWQYKMEKPDCELTIQGKKRNFWLKSKHSLCQYHLEVVNRINRLEGKL